MNRLMIVAAAALFALGLTGCGDKDAKPAAQDTTVTSTAPAPMEEKTAPAAAPEAQQPATEQQPAADQQPATEQQPAAEGQENH